MLVFETIVRLMCVVAIGATSGSITFDVNDILSVPLMPVSWLMLDAATGAGQSANISNRINEKPDGTFDIAYTTMGYHRTMLKEYMCSNFLANSILHEVAPSHFQNRLGLANASAEPETLATLTNRNNLVDAMKFDEGSSGYKDWLAKTTTLDDIYQHYTPKKVALAHRNNDAATNHLRPIRRQDKPVHEDYEEGDVTGYAMQQPSENMGGLYTQTHPHIHNYAYEGLPQADSKVVLPFLPESYPQPIYDGFLSPQTQFQHPTSVHPTDVQPHHPHHTSLTQKLWSLLNPFKKIHASSPHNYLGYEYSANGGGGDAYGSHVEHGGSSKEMGLKDIFDIALTTLAFLSFGMFILQVLMCVTMSKSDNSNMVLMPIDEVIDEVDGGQIRRRRRSTDSSISLTTMNELTRTVLQSIDAVQMADQDQGKCLRYTQCESNKQSRTLNTSQKMWIPVWNLGLSWLASKVIRTQPKSSSILEGLKASAYGLGRANCIKMFPCSRKYSVTK